MRWYGLFFIALLCNNCTNKFDRNLTFRIDGLFTQLEIGLIEKDSIINNEKYFSIYVVNNDTIPITIATTGEEKFYSPLSTEYSYFSEKYGVRKSGRGISDFFSIQETDISPSRSGEFYFYAAIPPSTDTVSFVFKYLKGDSTCFVETSHFLKDMKVMSLLNYDTFCE